MCHVGQYNISTTIMHGLSDVNINELLTMVEDDYIIRRHPKKVHKQYTLGSNLM